jgi:hypothetical protein
MNMYTILNGKRTESHRTKSNKTPRTKSHNLYFLNSDSRTHLHIVTFCPTYIWYMNQGIYIYIVTFSPTYIHVKQKYKL